MFEPQTRQLHGESAYRILILDGYASHITTAAISFAIANKIILLCLPPHTTHILQPLDVAIFAPLALAHKKRRYGSMLVCSKLLYQHNRLY